MASDPSAPYYPPVAFRFSVTVGLTGLAAMAAKADASFQEVSGIRAEWSVEEVAEGGENRFVHRLPTTAKYPNLTLKRGVVTTTSLLAEWASLTLASGLAIPIVPQPVIVMLLNEQNDPLIAWIFFDAYPVKWETSTMSAMDNAILTETLELSYSYFERIAFNFGSVAAGLARVAAVAAASA